MNVIHLVRNTKRESYFLCRNKVDKDIEFAILCFPNLLTRAQTNKIKVVAIRYIQKYFAKPTFLKTTRER